MTFFESEHRIVKKIVIHAQLSNESPLLIGRGESERVDKAMMLLPDGRAYVPASSFAGSLKSTMTLLGLGCASANWLWGSLPSRNETGVVFQSHLQIDDLYPVEEKVEEKNAQPAVRDGVKIDPKTGTAEDSKKYDYEVLEPGKKFNLKMEITIRKGFSGEAAIDDCLSDIRTALEHDEFRLGAFTGAGFGKMNCVDFQAAVFDFPQHADAWFDYLSSNELPEALVRAVEIKKLPFPDFAIEAVFSLKSSLLIGAYETDPNKPDKTHLKSNGKHVLPGKSIRGAIRQRARRILRILTPVDEGVDPTDTLFGYVDEDRNEQRKGRIRVEETIIPSGRLKAMIQNRIRIDRFTGGVIDGALFNSEPLWTTGEESLILKFVIPTSADHEDKRLLILLLKDLWLGDLPIGGEKNVGRGVLLGKAAKVFNKGALLAEFTTADSDGSPKLKWEVGSAGTIEEIINE